MEGDRPWLRVRQGPRARKVDAREKKLALQLVDTLSGSFEPDKYKDTYRDVLMAIIEQKRRRQAVRAPTARKRPAKVANLVQALEKNLAQPRRVPEAGRKHRRAA